MGCGKQAKETNQDVIHFNACALRRPDYVLMRHHLQCTRRHGTRFMCNRCTIAHVLQIKFSMRETVKVDCSTFQVGTIDPVKPFVHLFGVHNEAVLQRVQ